MLADSSWDAKSLIEVERQYMYVVEIVHVHMYVLIMSYFRILDLCS